MRDGGGIAKNMREACFSSSLTLGSLALLAPKSAAADLSHRSGCAILKRPRKGAV